MCYDTGCWNVVLVWINTKASNDDKFALKKLNFKFYDKRFVTTFAIYSYKRGYIDNPHAIINDCNINAP